MRLKENTLTLTLIFLMLGLSLSPLANTSIGTADAGGARSQPCNAGICLNEVMPNPSGYDDATWPGGEWLELFNNGSSSLSILDWYVTNKQGKVLNFNSSTIVNYSAGSSSTWTMAVGDYIVIARDGYSNFWLTNTQDDLNLYDSQGTWQDEASWSSAGSGDAYVENPADAYADWIVAPSATPGSNNSGAQPPTYVQSDLKISEVMPNSYPSYDNASWPGGEWVEVHNTGASAMNLSGWSLEDAAGNSLTFDQDHLVGYDPADSNTWQIQPDEYRVIAVNATSGYGVLNNGQEDLTLILPNGSIAETIQWSNAIGGVSLSEDSVGALSNSFFPTPGEANANWLPAVINGTADISLNEVLPNSTVDGDPYPNGEWIEIHNSGSSAIDLAGWSIKDSLGIITWLDTNSLVNNSTQMGTTIAAGGYRLIQTGNVNLLWEDWDTLSLYDPMGSIVDALHWVNDFGTDISLIGQEDVASPWLNSPYNTPGQPNPSSGSASNAEIFINEVMSDPAGNDSSSYPGGEWIELLNLGNDSVDLAGWNFLAGGFKDFNIDAESMIGKNSTIIESGEYVIVAVNSSGFYLRNTNGDSLELRDGADSVVHSIIWSIEVSEGESLFAPPSNASANWIQTPWPTPGAPNPIFGTYFGATTIEMSEVLAHCADDSISPVDDWIELHNTGNEVVNLSRWTLTSGDGDTWLIRHDRMWNISSTDPNATLLAPDEYAVVLAANYFVKGYGDSLALADPNGNAVAIITWTITTDCRTMGPTDNAADPWIQTLWPTPGEENPDPADYDFDIDVRFTRLMPYQTDYDSRNNEFFELTNFANNTVDLAGFELRRATSTGSIYNTSFTNLVLDSGQAVAISPDAAHLGLDGGFPAVNATSVMESAVFLSDAGGTLQLIAPDQTIVDAVTWGGAQLPIEGWSGPAITDPNVSTDGLIYMRGDGCGDTLDTNTSADWEQKWSRLGASHLCLEPTFDATGNLTPLIGPNVGMGDMLAWIDSAQTSLHVHLYQLHSDELAFALRQAAGRGVEVTVVINEGEYWWAGNEVDSSYGHASDLVSAGATVLLLGEPADSEAPDGPYAYIHSKVAVKDGESVWMGSGNWKSSSFPMEGDSGNVDWGIIVESTVVANMVLQRLAWDEDIAHSHIIEFDEASQTPNGWVTPAPNGAPQSVQGVTVNGDFDGRILTCPDDCVEGIVDSIAGAESEILLSLQYLDMDWYWGWGPNPILTALQEAAQRGVAVRMVINGYYYDEEIQEAVDTFNHEWNHSNGWDVAAVIMSPGEEIVKLHNKGMIIDSEAVLISSINWGANSILRNREMGILISNDEIASQFRQAWLQDWERLDTCTWEDTEYCTDTDGDGLPDFWEVAMGLNRTNALIAGLTIDESGIDSDGDGLWNQLEYDYDGDPFLSDTDGDCISDDREVFWADGLEGLSNDLKKEFARKAMRSDDANENNISDGEEFDCGADFAGSIIIEDDTDGDGVVDSLDLCPNTTAGTSVDADGCEQVGPTDSDGDGIPDETDDCPQTPANTAVTPTGCSDQQLRDKAGSGTNAEDEDNSANFMLIIMIIAVILLTGSVGGILMSRRGSMETMDDITLHAEMGGSLEPIGDYTAPMLDATAMPILDGSAGPVLDGSKQIPEIDAQEEPQVTPIQPQASEIDMSLFPGWGEDVVKAYLEQGWSIEQLKDWYDGNS